MSVNMDRSFDTIFLVCSFVCLQHNSKTSDPKVFKLGIGNDLGILEVTWFCG